MARSKRPARCDYECFNDGTSQSVDVGEYRVKVTGYCSSSCRQITVHLFSVCLLGLPYIWFFWYPQLWARLAFTKSCLDRAHYVLIKNRQGHVIICQIHWYPTRYFDYQLQRFIWNVQTQCFELLVGLQGTCNDLIESATGVSVQQREARLEFYKSNEIDIKKRSYGRLLIDEILNPFYVFEIFSIILWCWDEYYHYAICVAIMSSLSILVSVSQTKRQSDMLRNMVSEGDTNFITIVDERGANQIVSSSDLVPGDVVMIPSRGCLMTCDAVLLSGSCITNESVLTGESVPVTKIPLDPVDDEYEPSSTHGRHTLFCGTQVIQTRFYSNETVKALVVRTGSMTAKGQLVRSILFPKGVGFDFYRDAIRFVVLMFFIALVGMAYALHLYIERGAGIETMLLRVLDIITIVVPPALPAAMTVGTVYAQNRLKNQGVFCTAPARINVAGKVKLVCFDKTGTLTEEGLSVWGVLMAKKKLLNQLYENPEELPLNSPIVQAMATCHSLTKIDNTLCGDPLDISMFNSIEWELEEPGTETNRYDMLMPTVVRPRKYKCSMVMGSGSGESVDMQVPFEIGIVRQFHFSSNLQCMSVITRTLGENHMKLFTKGAPEKIISCSIPESLPANLASTLAYYTSSGFRVIAVGYKEFPRKFKWTHAQRAKREEVETQLTFLGLILMQNTLKPQSAPVIKQLQLARIKCLMVTGDNMLTAVSVSRECGLVSSTTPLSQVIISQQPPYSVQITPLHSNSGTTEVDASSALVIDGPTWAQLNRQFQPLLPLVATRGVIFARMSPPQKTHVIEILQSLDYIVAMVGDGANDCGALKAAHIGISLSDAEASIAAPFTSANIDITCVPKLIMEGRCSLVTSFGLFKFMAMYSLCQFSSVLILYVIGMEMGTTQFLYVDLVITTSLAVVMGKAGPAKSLVDQRPITTLVSAANVVPLILQLFLTIAMQLIALELLHCQPWFTSQPPAEGDEEIVLCWENTVVFLISCYQYVIIAIVYSKGEPHRQPFIKNWMMLSTSLALICFNTTLLLAPFDWLTAWFELQPVGIHDFGFRVSLVFLPAIQFSVAILIEDYAVKSKWFKWCLHKVTRKTQFKNKYKTVESQILNTRFWDPLHP